MGVDEYMETLLELQTQVTDMSPLDALDIYLGGLEPVVRIHLLGSEILIINNMRCYNQLYCDIIVINALRMRFANVDAMDAFFYLSGLLARMQRCVAVFL